jgi:hypothetical protein
MAGDRHWRGTSNLARLAKQQPAETREKWGLELVPEASDRYGLFWRSRDAVVLARGATVQAWVATDAQQP